MLRLAIRIRNVLVRAIHVLLHLFWVRSQRVLSGPFEGMLYRGEVRRSASLPKLLGTYEIELYPTLRSVIEDRRYTRVIDLGCAEGYFLVGLALARTDWSVIGSDASNRALQRAGALATRNGVLSRVQLIGRCDHGQLDPLLSENTFILCDIEGAEYELLDPARCPRLAFADLLVEVHEFGHPGLSDELEARFRRTHEAARISICPSLRLGHQVQAMLRLPSFIWTIATFEMRNPLSHWLSLRRRAT
jgi:SAM-dependent methyltransferase